MSFRLNTTELEKLLGQKNHKTGYINAILPFTTHAMKELKVAYYNLTGDIVRNICNVRLDFNGNVTETYEENPLIVEIKSDIKFEASVESDLERLLHDYLYGISGEMKITHPYLFNYLPIPDKEIYRKVSNFTADVLVGTSYPSVKDIFLNKTTDNILDELILNKLKVIFGEESTITYQNKLPILQELYCEDLMYLSKHKEYFLNTFPLITRFYIFNYVCQLLLKFDAFDKADYSRTTPLYYALAWEGNIGKRRKAADDIEGFKRVRERSKFLFVHMHTLSQLSYITQNLIDKKYSFLQYREIIDYLEEKGPNAKSEYLDSMQEWIEKYGSIFTKRVTEKNKPSSIVEGFQSLFKSVSEGTSETAAKKFGGYIEDLGGNDFLKVRGSSGTVLNLSHEMLLLLTSVCVKDVRIPLNQLFEGFEKRGVKLDRISKKIVVELLDNLNYIDKKSDSGDAQYVKPIL